MSKKRILVEITTESEAYKDALKFYEKNNDIAMFNTIEKVIEYGITLGLYTHLSSNLKALDQQAEKYREKKKDTNFA